MALADTVFGRLQLFFREPPFSTKVDSPKQTLGSKDLGFDDIAIQGAIRDALQSNDRGFGDLLTSAIPRTEFDESSSVGDVRDFILQHTGIQNLDQYEAKMAERVRLALRDLVGSMATPPVSPPTVLMTDPLSKYIAAPQKPALRSALNSQLFKYLFRPIPIGELDGLLSTIQGRIVNRMLI